MFSFAYVVGPDEKGCFEWAKYKIHIMHLDLDPENSLTTKISLPKGSPMIAAYLNGWKNTLGMEMYSGPVAVLAGQAEMI